MKLLVLLFAGFAASTAPAPKDVPPPSNRVAPVPLLSDGHAPALNDSPTLRRGSDFQRERQQFCQDAVASLDTDIRLIEERIRSLPKTDDLREPLGRLLETLKQQRLKIQQSAQAPSPSPNRTELDRGCRKLVQSLLAEQLQRPPTEEEIAPLFERFRKLNWTAPLVREEDIAKAAKQFGRLILRK